MIILLLHSPDPPYLRKGHHIITPAWKGGLSSSVVLLFACGIVKCAIPVCSGTEHYLKLTLRRLGEL